MQEKGKRRKDKGKTSEGKNAGGWRLAALTTQ
jgi:hypothetical protein